MEGRGSGTAVAPHWLSRRRLSLVEGLPGEGKARPPPPPCLPEQWSRKQLPAGDREASPRGRRRVAGGRAPPAGPPAADMSEFRLTQSFVFSPPCWLFVPLTARPMSDLDVVGRALLAPAFRPTALIRPGAPDSPLQARSVSEASAVVVYLSNKVAWVSYQRDSRKCRPLAPHQCALVGVSGGRPSAVPALLAPAKAELGKKAREPPA